MSNWAEFMNIVVLLMVLIAVAFYTLLERKCLSYVQTRKGPNKVGVWGILQPISDAVKLLIKEPMKGPMKNSMLFMFSALILLSLYFSLWLLYPSSYSSYIISWGLLIFFGLTGVGVYPMMFSGWSSNCKYSLIGSFRAVAQTISYEICLLLILLSSSCMFTTLSLNSKLNQSFSSLMLSCSFLMWVLCILAETNRAPFDFAEGESELVSGFNTEYMSVAFTLLFLGEYTSILFLSLFTSYWFEFTTTPLMFLMFIIVRGAYPRMRYDQLMEMCWQQLLPGSIIILTLFILLFF